MPCIMEDTVELVSVLWLPGWYRSASGRGLLGVSGRGAPPPKMSGKINYS